MKPARKKDVKRWDPLREFDRLQNEIANLFDWTVGQRGGRGETPEMQWSPDIDVIDEEKEYIIKADIPGIKPEDLDVRVEDGTLTIRGERKVEEEDKDKNYYYVERSYGSFVRSFQLPAEVDAGKVEASYKNGVLELKCPKTEKSQARKIEIKTR